MNHVEVSTVEEFKAAIERGDCVYVRQGIWTASGSTQATRFVACPVKVSEIAVHPNGMYPDKVKAPGCVGKVWECDIDGERLKEAK